MADFVKKTWACGDTITADDLNRMEDGIASANSGGGTAPLIVRAQSFVKDGTTVTLTFDKTWQEVHDAIANGTPTYLGSSSPSSNSDLCNSLDLSDFNANPVLVPIYEAYVDGSEYAISTLGDMELGIDVQNNSDELMTMVADCDKR